MGVGILLVPSQVFGANVIIMKMEAGSEQQH